MGQGFYMVRYLLYHMWRNASDRGNILRVSLEKDSKSPIYKLKNFSDIFLYGVIQVFLMCGIWAVFGSDEDVFEQCKDAHRIRHRGPDASRIETINHFHSCCLGFYRLSIMDDLQSMQPMRVFKYPHIWLIYNGEIYNYKLEEFTFNYTTQCDGESIIHLYARGGIEFAAKHLDGVFAFCLLDTSTRKVFLGRDTFGVKPLFRLTTRDGFLGVCSEAKGLVNIKGDKERGMIEHILPGHVDIYDLDTFGHAAFAQRIRFHKIGAEPVYSMMDSPKADDVKLNIRNLLDEAVNKRMMAERRIGCLLSGGLDSSLVTATLVKLAREKGLPYPIQTFSIGIEGSTDLAAAKKVAHFLGTEHHEVFFTPAEGLAALEEVIYFLECFDAITIRGAIGMYLVCKYIKENTDTTVLLSGEGSDEIAQGYIYFHKSPSPKDSDEESRRLCEDLYFYDLIRTDRMGSAWGLEIRVPFLDHRFTSYYLSLEPKERIPRKGFEKYLLRSSYEGLDLIPAEILWRPKEGFSDGVAPKGHFWYDIIQENAAEKISDAEFEEAKRLFACNPPISKEALFYRKIFEKYYPGQGHLTPYYWMPKWTVATDPSPRILPHYKQ